MIQSLTTMKWERRRKGKGEGQVQSAQTAGDRQEKGLMADGIVTFPKIALSEQPLDP